MKNKNNRVPKYGSWAIVLMLVIGVIPLVGGVSVSDHTVSATGETPTCQTNEVILPTIHNVYYSPSEPMGHEWDLGDGGEYNVGWGGDIITVYAKISGVVEDWQVFLSYGYCHDTACVCGEPTYGPEDDPLGPPWILPMGGWLMTHEGGDLYSYKLLGDWQKLGLPTYPASVLPGMHVYGFVYAKNSVHESVSSDEFDFTLRWPEAETSADMTISKEKIDGPDEVQTHTRAEWTLEVIVANQGGSDALDVFVHDVIPAEYELLEYTFSSGSLTTEAHGSTHITWQLGTMNPGDSETLIFMIATTTNGAGKQEFTTPGIYTLNDGAWVEFTDALTNSDMIVGPTDSITVTAVLQTKIIKDISSIKTNDGLVPDTVISTSQSKLVRDCQQDMPEKPSKLNKNKPE